MSDQLFKIDGLPVSDPQVQLVLSQLWNSPFSAVEFELWSSGPSGDVYHLDFAADDRTIDVELVFHPPDPLLVNVVMAGRWATLDVATQLALRDAIVSMHGRGVTHLVWRSSDVQHPLARVTAGATPSFAFQRGFTSVTQVQPGVYELKLAQAVDFSANAAVFATAIRASGLGADLAVTPVDSQTLRVNTDAAITGASADMDFYVRIDTL